MRNLTMSQLKRIFPALFRFHRDTDPLDTEAVIEKLQRGLNGLCDADGRNTGEAQYASPTMTVEDATLAAKILETLRGEKS